MATESQQIFGRAAFAAVVRALAGEARRQFDLLSYDLDRSIYGSPELVETVKLFLLGSEAARMRILLNQPRQAVMRGHGLIEFARQLSSRVEFRELPPERVYGNRGELLIVDRRAVLELREHGTLEAMLWRDAPDIAKNKGDHFDALWAESLTAQDLRKLDI